MLRLLIRFSIDMTSSAYHLDPRAWRNQLPAWIVQDDPYQRMVASMKRSLQAIADKCDRADEQGNLLGAFGGQALYKAAGCSARSMWTHIDRFSAMGYVVCIGRGGRFANRTLANIYGIPGRRGGLDHRRARRELRTMDKGRDGKFRPTIIQPGEQAMLWRPESGGSSSSCPSPPGPSSPRGSAEKLHTPREKLHTPPCAELHTTIRPDGHPDEKDHGALRPKSAPKRLGHVHALDLTDMRRLLALFDRAVTLGLADPSENGRMQFVAAAEHARRLARRNAPGLFASIVNDGRWLYITQRDEEAAAARWRSYQSPRPTPPEPLPRSPRPELSADARIAAAAQKLGAQLRRDPFRIIKTQFRDWSRQRFDAAVAEVEASR